MAFVDETHGTNEPKPQRVLSESGQKRISKQPIGKFGISFTGFQGVNCTSYITSNEHSNAFAFIRGVCSYRLLTCINTEAETIINEVLSDEELLEHNIIKDLRVNLPNKKELQENINNMIENDDSVENILISIEKLCKNEINDSYNEISKLQRKKLVENLRETNIKYVMEKETPLILVLDNAKIHSSYETKEVFDLLNIIPIYLEPYCPQLNPIEDVWRVCKKIVYTEGFEDLYKLIDIVIDSFYQNANNKSFYKNWIKEYMV